MTCVQPQSHSKKRGSGGCGEHWCEVNLCVLASVPLVAFLISLVSMVCEVDLPSVSVSVSDNEIVEPQGAVRKESAETKKYESCQQK